MKRTNTPLKHSLRAAFPVAIAAFAMTMGSGAAHAQDGDENFEGVSIGAQGGYSRARIDETVLSGTDAVTLDAKESGITYGGYIGYDAQFEQFVLGAEAGFNPNGPTITGDIAGGGTATLDPKWSADASVRAGVVLADRVLVYGRAGYARTRVSVNRFAAGNTAATASENENRDGFMFGGGAEFAVNRNAALRVEYRRANLSGSLRSDQVLAGATLRF